MARTQIASDLFSYTDGDLNASGNWTDLHPAWGTTNVISNTIRGADATTDTPVRWSGADAGLFTADQYFEILLAAGSRGWDSASFRLGGVLRPSGSDATRSYYAVYMANDNDIGQPCLTRVVKVVNGTETVLSSTTIAWADLDVISAEVITNAGNAEIRAYRNGVLITALGTSGVVTDSSSPLTSSTASGAYIIGSNTRPVGDAWAGGNVTGSGIVIPVFINHLRTQGIA